MDGEEKHTNFELHQNDVLVIPAGVNPNHVMIIRPEDNPPDVMMSGLAKPT